MANLLYGSGLRQMECLRLRVHDIDFTYRQITVRDAKGGKPQIVILGFIPGCLFILVAQTTPAADTYAAGTACYEQLDYQCAVELLGAAAREERQRLLDGEDSRVLRDCATCYACEEYCPYDNHPFYLLVERQEGRQRVERVEPAREVALDAADEVLHVEGDFGEIVAVPDLGTAELHHAGEGDHEASFMAAKAEVIRAEKPTNSGLTSLTLSSTLRTCPSVPWVSRN